MGHLWKRGKTRKEAKEAMLKAILEALGPFGVVAVLLIPGLICGTIAEAKGRSGIGFVVYGTVLFPVALIHALIMKNEKQEEERGRPMRGFYPEE